ncbi:MAG: MATE family efflux transporter [Roseburia sp.]|nr:MATE family efflux transporter [Roseburia sp.]
MKNLTSGQPLKLILIFAVPLFIGQLFQLFYSLVDTRIVGETLGEASLAAVGATTALSDMLVGLLNGFTNGAAIIVASFFGAGNERYMRKAAGGTVVLGAGFAVLISVLCLLFLTPILCILNIDADILPEARSYISVILAGLLAATLYNICAAILRAVGDSFTPLIFLMIASFLNIFLDYLFILLLHAGVAGAAYATVISQAFSAALCFVYMRRKYPQLVLGREDLRPSAEIVRRLLPTGISMGFMVSFVNLGTVALQTGINTFGTNIIVAHTAARKATSIFMLPFSVLGTTLATYCGQNLGAGKYSRIRTGIRDTVLLTFAWCVLVILTAYTLSPYLIRMITASEEKEIIDTASLYLRVNTSFYFVPAVICLFRNSMQGFGDSRTPVFSSSLELIGKVAIAFFLAPAIGYMGIIVAEPIVWFVMVIPLIVNMARNPIFKKEESAENEV